MKKITKENTPNTEIPYRRFDQPFRFVSMIPGKGIVIEQDNNGVCYISTDGGYSFSDLVAGDNIDIQYTEDGKIVISSVNTAVDIAAGENITIDIDPETGKAVINSIVEPTGNEHYQGIFDTPQDLIAADPNPEAGDFGLIRQVTITNGEISFNGNYKYLFWTNGSWTLVDQMLTFTDNEDLINEFYSVGGSSPTIYLHKVARTGDFWHLRNIPIVATPVVTVNGDTVTVTCETEGAEIWYTTDGTMPHVNGTRYVGPITVTGATDFRFVGIKNGMINSKEATASAGYALQAPTISLDWHTGEISMENPNGTGDIHYTTDGTTPTAASAVYDEPFVITQYTHFKLAVFSGAQSSDVVDQTYQKLKLNGGSLNLNPAYGTIRVNPMVVSDAGNIVVENALLKYTEDGNDPTFSSDDFVNSIQSDYYAGVRTVKERGFAEGYIPSDTKSLQIGEVKPVSPPVIFDPDTNTVSLCNTNVPAQNGMDAYGLVDGLFGGSQGRVLFYSTGSLYSRIYYTLDGSTPTDQSTLYTGPFQILGNVTVKAVLVAYRHYYSDVTTEDIEITNTPTISLNSDTGDISITGPEGSTIYYTRDGSEPTTESTQYTEPFNVENERSVTVKAIAVVDGQPSATAEVTFPGLLTQWRGESVVDTNYDTGKILRTPKTAADGATVYYAIGKTGDPQIWQPYEGKPVEMDLFSNQNPREIMFRQTKPGWIPAWYGSVQFGYTKPDSPTIDFDVETNSVSFSLRGNTSNIPLQTNNNVPEIGARIYYTIDGTIPPNGGGTTLWDGNPIQVNPGTIVRAITHCYGRYYSNYAQFVSPDYLCFETLEDNNEIGMVSYLDEAPDMEYSTNGVDFQAWRHTTSGDTHTFDTINLQNIGDKVYFRGTNQMFMKWFSNTQFTRYTSTKKFEATGDIQTLVNSGFYSNTAITFGHLFQYTKITKAPKLSANILVTGAYFATFADCEYLIEGASISAKNMTASCCNSMYRNCVSLVSPSEITVNNYGEGCFVMMYEGCTSLTKAADCSADRLVSRCCEYMYRYCRFLMSDDASTFNFNFGATLPQTVDGVTYSTPRDVAAWMGNLCGFDYMVPESALADDVVARIFKDNETGVLKYFPQSTYDASKFFADQYTEKDWMRQERNRDGITVMQRKTGIAAAKYAEDNRYKLYCDTTANGGFTIETGSWGTVNTQTIAWNAGDTLDDIVALFTSDSYVRFSHVQGEDFIRVLASQSSSSYDCTLSNNTGGTVVDLSKQCRIGGIAQAETHRVWQGTDLNTMFPDAGIPAANTVQYAKSGLNLSYRCGGNPTTYMNYYEVSGSGHGGIDTYLAEDAVSARMSRIGFASCNGSGNPDAQALYDKYEGSWEAYMEASMIDGESTNANGIVDQTYSVADTVSPFLASVETADFTGEWIPAFPIFYNAYQVVDVDFGHGIVGANHDMSVYMDVDTMTLLNSGGCNISRTSYYWSVAQCYANDGWIFHGHVGTVGNGRKYSDTFSARVLAYIRLN